MADLERYYRIVRRPHVTEKVLRAVERNRQYAFEVAERANKIEVRQAIEAIFNVKVEKVHTQNYPGKTRRVGRWFGRTPVWKKAIVTLKEGHAIEDFY
jgi:large subunit ribosomal protein L23